MKLIITPSRALFYFCISFVVGIGFNSIIKIPQMFLWGFLFLGVLIVIFSLFTFFTFSPNSESFQNLEKSKNSKVLVLGFCTFFLVLGIIRFQITEFNIEHDKLREFNDKPEKIVLLGQIIDGPDIRDKFQKLKIKIDGTNSIVLVNVRRYPEYNYLDKIKITGYLKTPIVAEDFNYKNYLLKDGIYSVMDFPKTELLPSKNRRPSVFGEYNIFSFSYERILFFKKKLNESITATFSSSHSALLQGIILGSNKNMSQDLKDRLNSAGIRHITAVSGSHIIILSSILMSSLLFLGLWRGQAFYFSIILIWLYIILIGFPASGVRAAIMGSIFLLAQKLGRQNTSSRTITIAGTLMLLQNPLLLFYDVGFHLSFLASMGIIHLKPLITTFNFNFNMFKNIKIKTISEKILNYIIDIISVTLSAQIFTLPIIVYNFGTVSLVAPITNLLILPTIPFLMSFGFIAAFLGIFSNFLGWVFYLPSWILLTYFLSVVDIFYQPWAVKSVENVSWIWFVLYYFIIWGSVLYLNKKLKPKFLGY